jgi:hypothetical protein
MSEPMEVQPIEEALTAEPAPVAAYSEPQPIQPQATSVYDRMTDPLAAIEKLGEIIARSGMCGCSKLEQGQLLAMHCLSEKITPLELAKRYHIINGNLSMRSDTMLAEFQKRGGVVEWLKYDDKIAEANFTIGGRTTKISFTMAEAAKAGLPNKGTAWKAYPGAMLRSRLVSKALRMVCAEAVVGIYTPDELSDRAVSPEEEKQLFSKG